MQVSRLAGILMIVSVFCLAADANAQFFRSWIDSSGGAYGDPFNWSPVGVPSVIDGAGFALNATYTVTFPSNQTTGVVSVSDGDVAFDLNVGTSRTLTIPGTLTVRNASAILTVLDGTVAAGGILVEDGGQLNGTLTGFFAVGDSDLTVRDPGSSWLINNGFLRVGENGTGTLLIQDGGHVFNSAGIAIGRFGGSNGTSTVTGGNSMLEVGANLTVGQDGTGTLLVEDGGSVSSSGINYLGFSANASGTTTVDGPGSNWTYSNDLNIGFQGSGNMTISNGGNVASSDPLDSFINSIIASEEDSIGTVTVTGANSNWIAGRNAQVGFGGQGTLTVAAGGAAALGVSSSVGGQATGDGTIIVTDANSLLDTDSFFVLGGQGKGTLKVLNGARMTHRRITIADRRFGIGVVEVDGPGSTIESSNETINVGHRGEGDLTIRNSGTVTSSSGSVGVLDDSLGTGDGQVTIVGGGTWTISNDLAIGGKSNFPANGGSGLVRMFSGGVLDVGDEIVLYPDGVLDFFSGDVFANAIRFEGGDFVWDFGTLHVGQYHGDLVNIRGVLAPGDPTGNTLILGDYTQQSSGTLQIELGGTGMGTTFDFVNVTGIAIVDGNLELGLVNGFTPSPTDTFIVFNATTLLGIFDNVANNQRFDTTDGSGSFLVHYGIGSSFGANQIVMSDFIPACPADIDQSGTVNVTDLLTLLAAWGDCPPPCPPTCGADINADCTVNVSDLLALLAAWGDCP